MKQQAGVMTIIVDKQFQEQEKGGVAVIDVATQEDSSKASPSKLADTSNTSSRPNNFNFDCIQALKVQPISQGQTQQNKPSLLSRFGDVTVLNIDDNETPINPVSTSRSRVHTYVVEGVDHPFRTNELNLLQKINLLSHETNQPAEQPDQEQSKEVEQEERTTMRYFANTEQKKKYGLCRRCHQPGHFQRNCTEEVKVSCIYCLGTHSRFDCGKFLCFNCNEQGHMGKDCKVRSVRCNRCGKNGHRQNQCGVLIMREQQNNSYYNSNDLKRLVCLACGKRDHMNCFKAPLGDDLYQESEVLEIDKDQYGSSPEKEKSSKRRRKEDREERSSQKRKRPLPVDEQEAGIIIDEEKPRKKRKHHEDSTRQYEDEVQYQSRGHSNRGHQSEHHSSHYRSPQQGNRGRNQQQNNHDRRYQQQQSNYQHTNNRYDRSREHSNQFQQDNRHRQQEQNNRQQHPYQNRHASRGDLRDYRQAFNNDEVQFIQQINQQKNHRRRHH